MVDGASTGDRLAPLTWEILAAYGTLSGIQLRKPRRSADVGPIIIADKPRSERQRLGELYALGLLDSAADPAFDEVTRLAQRLFSAPIALVSLIDEDRQWFKSRQGLDVTETPRDVAFCAHSILGEGVFVVENACEDPRFMHNPLVTEDPSIRFYAGAPLRTPSGQCIGTLCVIDDEPRQASAEDLSMLRDLASIVEREIAQASAAVTDPLTGLHNRRGFMTVAKYLLRLVTRTGDPLVLAYADLDHLKRVNDEHGHEAGDAAICATARLLRNSIREADIVARVGGDEFALLLGGTGESGANVPLDRLREALEAHNQGMSPGRALSLSIGWVEWKPGESIRELIVRGDQAMYAQKQLTARRTT